MEAISMEVFSDKFRNNVTILKSKLHNKEDFHLFLALPFSFFSPSFTIQNYLKMLKMLVC